jgi:hypothetical protein
MTDLATTRLERLGTHQSKIFLSIKWLVVQPGTLGHTLEQHPARICIAR